MTLDQIGLPDALLCTGLRYSKFSGFSQDQTFSLSDFTKLSKRARTSFLMNYDYGRMQSIYGPIRQILVICMKDLKT